MARVTARLTGSFSRTALTPETEGASLSLEWDGRADGLNNGKTSDFARGSDPAFLLYRSPNLTALSFDSTAGRVAYVGAAIITQETEYLEFGEGEQTKTLSKPVQGDISAAWEGNDGGSFALQEDKITVRLAAPVPAGRVFVLAVDYASPVLIYRLTALPATVDRFAILAIGATE